MFVTEAKKEREEEICEEKNEKTKKGGEGEICKEKKTILVPIFLSHSQFSPYIFGSSQFGPCYFQLTINLVSTINSLIENIL